ncbi:hypothetical protein A3K72_01095 [Candidatus Woesearchaeota archaeon RBG_13_36_6]|nr:MAG: hypothetical protein A3K72_01095 [Candidatus Woesearchaeota archaeon RBG_13_36_6]
MKKNKKTVFFGPFVGEFGWEIMYWQGWGKKLCRGKYRRYHKIACSFPWRNPLYPDVDEFWKLPKEFLKNQISSRSYITDNWIKGFPKPDSQKIKIVEVAPLFGKIVKKFKKKLPQTTIFVSPTEIIKDTESEKFYGTHIPKSPKSDDEFVTYAIPYSDQVLEYLQPTNKGIILLKETVDPKERIIAIFPRCRITRRPDKNWSKENYEELIRKLQKEFPLFKIAIFGEPGGAYFTEGVPKGCVDLINIKPEYRMDIQLAALKQSVIALGGQSGGIVFALAAGCRAFCWGNLSYAKGISNENYMKTKVIFYPDINPSIETVMENVLWILDKGKRPYLSQAKSFILITGYNLIPKSIKKSKGLAKFKKNIISKI